MDGISWAPALPVQVLLQDRDLPLELVDSVFEKEDFLSFGVGISVGQAFEATLANASREPSGQ